MPIRNPIVDEFSSTPACAVLPVGTEAEGKKFPAHPDAIVLRIDPADDRRCTVYGVERNRLLVSASDFRRSIRSEPAAIQDFLAA